MPSTLRQSWWASNFLDTALGASDTPPAVVDRLRSLLLSDKTLTEKTGTAAIFPDTQVP
jgi:hypothetical protein